MKDIEKIIADLKAWVEEDSENRAIALVAVQKLEDKENGYRFQRHTVAEGVEEYLVDAFQGVLSDKDPENFLRKFLKLAIVREVTAELKKIVSGTLDNSDKSFDNGSEEGKEAEHED